MGTDDTPLEALRSPHRSAEQGDRLVGALVAGRYRIEGRLGEGGIGRVYRATQEPLGREVAVKLLHPELTSQPELKRRFEREAQAASRLSHPGSVTVFDFGVWEGQLYLVMELVPGGSLADVIDRELPLTQARFVDLGAQLCDALGAAHALGLLHRDLKPENILIYRGPDGGELLKICDYGLAFVVGEDDRQGQRITKEGMAAGTPSFMAPEQILNRPLDQRADIYALGCVLYEMLVGQPPFSGETSMEVLTKQLYDEPVPPSRRTPFPIARELEQVVLWALKKSPSHRPQSTSELKAALLRAHEPAARTSERAVLGEAPFLDREQRAERAGIVPSTPLESPPPSSHAVLVIEPSDRAFESSAATVLRAQGSLVRTTAELGDPGAAEAVVVDVRPDAVAGVEAVGAALARLGRRPVLVVGPDDAFDAMTRALELQLAEYVPQSQLTSLPRRLHRAIERGRRSKP